jgi:hypothetical protein
LGADYVITNVASWRSSTAKPGAQIDLVIDRSDNLVDLCEMKFVRDDFVIDKAYEKVLRQKKTAFVAETKTRKAVRQVLVTTYGLTRNAYSDSVQAIVTIDDLFE